MSVISPKGKATGPDNGMFKHGMRGSPTYNSWSAMKQRCFYPKSDNYPHYGGRGISVCDRWLNFAEFFADMGERPEGMTLGRIDNDGDYEPGNVEWVTAAENIAEKNRRSAAAERRREALRVAMRAEPTMTNEALAEQLGVGNRTTMSVRRELEDVGEIPRTVPKPRLGRVVVL